MDKKQVMAMMDAPVKGLSISHSANYAVSPHKIQSSAGDFSLGNKYDVGDFPNGIEKNNSLYSFWYREYYPNVIYESYPVYIRERALDKGKQAFEIIKVLKDKKLIDMKKVGDFIDLMDELIKIL